ncbi:unnamed protein product [Protopolystoma xenopodis]|uniref:Histidine kinase/HSP90-like ATPase domain-containing protein n=1 Tax=Protopolystoma xenopodis TaxID=117903 RepID=A0A3S5CKX9_9PLAT|nr:unnamed protein product [Protopolystoma xenopodis]
MSLTNSSVLSTTPDLSIRIKANKADRTLHILDTGIGMTKDELIKNLGTIAKSGTSEFLSKISSSGSTDTGDLIGQFGVGFYSSFLVADKVTVISKSNNDDQYVWESDASSYSINKDPRSDSLKRGTELILHLKEEAEDYLDHDSLIRLVRKYSQFINFPIYVWSSSTKTVQEPAPPEEKSGDSQKDDDAKVEEEKKPELKTIEKTVWDWSLMNENKPIWMRKIQDVTEEEYYNFFKAFTKETENPLGKVHFSAEGEVSFQSILYIPARAPHDMYSRNLDTGKDNIKLYVRRVFITDTFDDLMPKYFNFIKGIVDSDDLPLNVSRENLQQSKLLKIIKKKLIRKVIEMISKLSESLYDIFWTEFGISIKLGTIEDSSNRGRMAKLLRFKSSHNETGFVSLADYVARMPVSQKAIYYITASDVHEAKTSPFVERLLKRGYEILYLVDPIDEYLSQSLTEFESKKLQNIAKEGVEIDQSDKHKEQKEAQVKEFEVLLTWLKTEALKDKIEKAALSNLLADSPCALVASSYGWSGNMERIMRSQAFQKSSDASTNFYASQKKTLDINPRHPLIKDLKNRVSEGHADERAFETALLLFDLAALRSGYGLNDSVAFAERIEQVMRKNLDVDLFEKAEEEYDDQPIVGATGSAAEDFKTDLDEESEEVAKRPIVEENIRESESTKKDEL